MPGLDTPQAVLSELFNSDEATKLSFQNAVSPQLLIFAEKFAPLYAKFQNFAKDCAPNKQASLVGGLMHCAIDDLLVSVKLLVQGHMSASANLARQSVEALCMSIMCAHEGKLKIWGKTRRIGSFS